MVRERESKERHDWEIVGTVARSSRVSHFLLLCKKRCLMMLMIKQLDGTSIGSKHILEISPTNLDQPYFPTKAKKSFTVSLLWP